MNNPETSVELSAEERRERARELTRLLCEGLACSKYQLDRWLKVLRWKFSAYAELIEKPDWVEQFNDAIRVAEEKEASGRLVAVVSGTGAEALARVPQDQLLNLCSGPLKRFVQEYEPEEHGGRLILGPTGCGKSSACVAAVYALLLKDGMLVNRQPEPKRCEDWQGIPYYPEKYVRPIAWRRAADLPNARLQASLGDGEAELVKDAFTTGLLILDDMGWESRRANAEDVVLEVIARRYDAGLATLVTSGLRLDQFTDRYGDAVVRRICEAAGRPGKVLDLWGKKP